jgi:hypothetical protein
MTKQVEKKRDGLLGGFILVIIGLIALANQFVDLDAFPDLGLLIVPGIGALLLLWGIVNREAGPIIPGSIMSGLGLGIILETNQLGFVNVENDGGLFMLSFALGWVLITVLTAVFTPETHWWALIPAGIMGLIGGSILVGGAFEALLTFLGTFWPVILIGLGIWILIQSFRGNKA